MCVIVYVGILIDLSHKNEGNINTLRCTYIHDLFLYIYAAENE